MKILRIFFLIILALGTLCISFSYVGAEETDRANIIQNQNGINRFTLDSIPKEVINVPVSDSGKSSLTQFLIFIQKILLQIVLPLVAVGCGIYIAYELFTANGDESKMKMAWYSIVYSIVAIISIALAAFIVSLISRLNIG